jgi:hypothetical protein
MNRIVKFTTLTLGLGLLSSALGACQAIAGIEDRHYQPVDLGAAGANSDGGNSPECIEYCNQAKSTCQTALDGTVVPSGILYLSDDACLATCKNMPLSGADQNSVACRMQQLGFVETGEDVETYCANAGPGGNGACGSNCENYCHLFASACQDEFKKYSLAALEGEDGTAVCVRKCLGLADTELFDSTKSATGNYYGDTLQCRLVHTSSSMLDPATHCSHAELKPSEGKCQDDLMATPDCKKFCHLERIECADFPMYESDAQCQAVCNALPRGHVGDQSENTVGCRMYHSYNALLDPKNHCTHTGPGGDGHCVTGEPDTGACESYCLLLEKACESDFAASFTDQAACQDECVKLDGSAANAGYTLSAKGNNLQCRLLNVSRALSDPSKYCAAAQGAAPCK